MPNGVPNRLPNRVQSAATLRLRSVELRDEQAVSDAQQAMDVERFVFAFGYTPEVPWAQFVQSLESARLGRDLVEHWVASTFLVADVDGLIVGRTSIRHSLNEFLAHEGGHIGYCVLPSQRRLGYATQILRLSLVAAREVGVERVLVCCDDDNIGSATIIERCGGKFERCVESGQPGPLVRRYWFE